ncbi:MAG: hypothetical protein C0429_06895 [Sphingopyxis sp.]|nr:hypothetical protein [Sphingopyxis sp.]
MVYLLLEEQYDETTNRYRPGWDDKRLAQESGASVNIVVQVREESFGPLGEPAEIADFKQDFAKVKADLEAMKATMEQTVETIEQRFERICVKNGWVV